MTDDLEKLLLDVRKTIKDNCEFLQSLAADVDAEPGQEASPAEPDKPGENAEEFEEL